MVDIIRRPHLCADWVHNDARQIVKTLKGRGFETYLVGGCVRDLLAEIHPKDFDIATAASPQQVKRAIYNSYIIGRRFRLVLAKRGVDQYEISTFRRSPTIEDLQNEDISGDNFFGTAEEDAVRRDFTINGLFYDPVEDKLTDYVGGGRDIDLRLVRMIGEPEVRLREDPIRILRAIRLAAKLRFDIDPHLRQAMVSEAEHLVSSVLPRKREEYLKVLRLSDPIPALFEMKDLGILKFCLPELDTLFDSSELTARFGWLMRQSRQFVGDDCSPTELFAFFLTAYIHAGQADHEGHEEFQKAFHQEANITFLKQGLGLFQTEIRLIAAALEIVPNLKDAGGFSRKGLRRQAAFLSHESLPLALVLARMLHEISGEEATYWELQLSNHKTFATAPKQAVKEGF